MLPDGHSRRFALGIPMLDERVERFRHMTIAQVPGFDAAPEHRAIVGFSVLDQPRVLLGKEEFILRHSSITARIISRAPAHLQ